jgi:hypothetical protein
LVEGIITIGVGVIVFIAFPPVSERVKWGFTADGKRLGTIRTWRANNTPNATFKWNQVALTFREPTFYSYLVMFCANQLALTALGSFWPAIIQGIDYSGTQAHLTTVPVYACAFVTTLVAAYISDKTRKHGYSTAISSTASLIGARRRDPSRTAKQEL